MDNQFNSLGNMIRISNSNLNEFDIVCVDGKNYITESSFINFLDENNITDSKMAFDSIKESNNIKDLNILNDSVCLNNEDLRAVYEVLLLLEDINPREVVKIAKGRGLLSKYISQFTAFVTNKQYSEASELKKYIDRCDKVLKDIEDEKKKCKEKSKNDSYKFSIMFLFNIAVTLFMTFVAPMIISKVNVQWPKAIEKMFFKTSAKMAVKKTINVFGKPISKSAILKTLSAAIELPDDLRGLYLSFMDYDKLLTEYETQIKKCRRDFYAQLQSLDESYSNKGDANNMSMNIMDFLTEGFVDPDSVSVHYQRPDSLKPVPGSEVFHDDDEDMEHGNDEWYHHHHHGDHEDCCRHGHDEHEEDDDECCEEKEYECKDNKYSTINFIKKVKYAPKNINVVERDGKYYVCHDDVRNLMDVYKEPTYEGAINKIISAHEGYNINTENVKVIMSESEFNNLDNRTAQMVRESAVQFEIYAD